jgi:tRNA U55 pseudouridine synthase TruB
MKTITKIITLMIIFFSLTIYSQNQNRRQNDRNTNNKEISKEDLEKIKEKSIENSITKLKIDLDLDELQAIAVKQIITESIRTENIIMKKEENEEDKMKSLQILTENTDSKINSILDKNQKEKFIVIKENLKKRKR